MGTWQQWRSDLRTRATAIASDLRDSVKTIAEDLVKGTEAVVEAGLAAAVGLFRDCITLWGLFAIVFVVGFTALTGRAVILWVAPNIAGHSRVWATIFDIVLDVIAVLETSIEDVIVVIRTIVIDIERLFHHGNGHKIPHLTSYKLVRINATGLADFMDHLVDDCGPYNTVESLVGPTFRRVVSPAVCPAIRYLYPIRHLYVAADAVLGWASYDSRPWPHGNCEPDPVDVVDPECIALGSGYLILEVLLPAILAVVVLLRLVPVLWRVTILCAHVATVTIIEAVCLVLELL